MRAVGYEEFEKMSDDGGEDVLSLLDASAARPASEAFATPREIASTMPAWAAEEAERPVPQVSR